MRTWGGRLIRFGAAPPQLGEGAEPDALGGAGGAGGPGGSTESTAGTDGSRGRYARNAIIQGSAAELFKAWAATVRHAVRPLGGQIVLCLHDEMLVHVPEREAQATVAGVESALTSAARTWAGTDQVRFVADTSVVRRWSEAKA